MDAHFWWPLKKFLNESEVILCFKSTGGQILSLISNYPYELWLDGVFIGDGGHRCVPNEAFIDRWEECKQAKTIIVRLHWMNVESCPVYHRCLFYDPFFGQLGNNHWECFEDKSIIFKKKVDSQLPCQNLISLPQVLIPLQLQDISTEIQKTWTCKEFPVHKSLHIPVELEMIDNKQLSRQTVNLKPFDPHASKDLLLYVINERPCELECKTYDLGTIALHRFELSSIHPCVLCYSEVPDFNKAWLGSNRGKVHMADGFVSKNMSIMSPFGHRGCRYVHVISLPDTNIIPKVWRREYPFKWKQLNNDPIHENILKACRANLIACVDGGLVDTCWRERAQWTGDARMSSLALQALTCNEEIIHFVVKQIAQSYNSDIGMVNGCWPTKTPYYKLPMPTFHLAFCLTVVEHKVHLIDPFVKFILNDTIMKWKKNYLINGLLRNMPGWYFVDWDTTNNDATGRTDTWKAEIPTFDIRRAHSVCNAWWIELCELLDIDPEININEFNDAFWTGSAFSLFEKNKKPSPHATIAVLASTKIVTTSQTEQSLMYIYSLLDSKELYESVSAYYAYFVAKALDKCKNRLSTLEFIHKFYDPIVNRFGTIYEKTNGNASLAHGWSIGISQFLVI